MVALTLELKNKEKKKLLIFSKLSLKNFYGVHILKINV
jgi:hypothetical protein